MKIYRLAILTAVFTLFFTSAYCQLWQDQMDSAKQYRNKKDIDKVIGFYTRAKFELKKDSLNTNTYAKVCDQVGLYCYRKEQYAEAEDSYREAKQTREKLGKETIEYAGSCLTLGNFYFDIDEFKKAKPLLLEADQILERLLPKEDPVYAALCNKAGSLFREMKEYPTALSFLQKAKDLREQFFGKDSMYASYCNGLANYYLNIEHYAEAEALYMEAMQIQKKDLGTRHLDYALTCANMGYLSRIQGHNEKAAHFLQEAMDIRKEVSGKDDPDYGLSCNSLAILYRNMGEYPGAELLLIETKRLMETRFGKQSNKYASACNSLASLYRDMGKYPDAEKLLDEAMTIQENLGMTNTADYSSLCYNLANLYRDMHNNEAALKLYQRAKEIDENLSVKSNSDLASSSNGLAAVYLDMGNFEAAADLYLDTKKKLIKQLKQQQPDYAITCNGLGIVYEKDKKYSKAEKNYQEAKKVWEDIFGKQHPYYGSTCANLANLYWVTNEPLKAEAEFQESFAVNTNTLNTVFQFTNEKEKAAFIKNVSGEDDKAYSFYVSEKLQSGLPYSISLFHRNLILSSLQALKQQLYSSNDSLLSNKYVEWMEMKQYLSTLYSIPITERKQNLDSIEERAGQLEKELVRHVASLEKQRQQVDWKDIQEKLQENEAAIEFVSFHFNASDAAEHRNDSVVYVALVLKKDGRVPVMVYLSDEKQLSTLLSSSNKKIKDAVTDLYTFDVNAANNKKNNSRSMYELIWKPIEKELKNIKTIYFAPAGMLHNIAFAALPVADGEILCERYKLVQLASTAAIADQKETYINADDGLQLYGGIIYEGDSTTGTRSKPGTAELTRGNSWKYLPSTAGEVNEIKNLGNADHHINKISGVSATEESIKALNGKNSPAVLHIATHGFFYLNPGTDSRKHISPTSKKAKVFTQSADPLFRSGLVFAGANSIWNENYAEEKEDGILTSYEVSNLYLPNTKLAVLSACETGLGDIQGSEGVYGLQRAFKIAGVKNLLMSLWQVPSEETKEFMQAFYRNIFAKQSINDAFYNAQMDMKNKYRDDPYKWAAWILVR